MRKYLTGLSAAGITAALVLTGAASGAAASPAPQASPHVVTLTSSTSSSAGNLTVKVRYQIEAKGKLKALSATVTGGTPIKFKHPALLLALRPVLSPPGGRGQVPAPGFGFTIFLRVRSASHFSVSLPAKLLAIISKSISAPPRRVSPGGLVLQAVLASVTGSRKPVNITTVLGLQVGVLLRPAAP
jgi:hypothetical protein